jgi:hypothetical protein
LPQQKSKIPIMDPVTPKEEQEGGRLSASDIARTKKPGYASYQNENLPRTPSAGSGKSVGDVPSFSDTQQKWEDPQSLQTPASLYSDYTDAGNQRPERGLSGTHPNSRPRARALMRAAATICQSSNCKRERVSRPGWKHRFRATSMLRS